MQADKQDPDQKTDHLRDHLNGDKAPNDTTAANQSLLIKRR